MIIFLLIFSLIRTLQGAPTPLCDPPVSDLDASFLWRRSLGFGTRGTNDIVLSCLATIFACTWTAIHPNIPSPTDCGWSILKRRVVTTVYALLAPELVVLWAMQQRIVAKRITDSYNKEIATVTATPDTRSFRERALGFVHQWFNDGPLPQPQEEDDVQRWTVTHGFFVVMGGFMLSEKGVPIQVLPYFKEKTSMGGKKKQGYEGLEHLIKQKVICAPTTTEADIKDRSKGDTISKTVVILQTTWFILQCFMRWSHGLTVTELEVVTLGFALLNGITYGLWWEKPQGAGVPVYLERRVMKELETVGESKIVVQEGPGASDVLGDDREPTGHDEADTTPLTASNMPVPSKRRWLPRKLAEDRRDDSSFLFWIIDVPYRLIRALLRPLEKMIGDGVIAEGALRVPMFYSAIAEKSEESIILYASSLIAVLFGSVHLIPAWFLSFPSSAEMWLWRLSAVVITTEAVLFPLAVILDNYDNSVSNVAKVIIFIPAILGFPLYIFARVILITLSFTTLRALPPDAYHTIDWVSSIPHL